MTELSLEPFHVKILILQKVILVLREGKVHLENPLAVLSVGRGTDIASRIERRTSQRMLANGFLSEK